MSIIETLGRIKKTTRDNTYFFIFAPKRVKILALLNATETIYFFPIGANYSMRKGSVFTILENLIFLYMCIFFFKKNLQN